MFPGAAEAVIAQRALCCPRFRNAGIREPRALPAGFLNRAPENGALSNDPLCGAAAAPFSPFGGGWLLTLPLGVTFFDECAGAFDAVGAAEADAEGLLLEL